MQDKLLKKALNTPASQLPYGFSNRVMMQIRAEIERKNKRNHIAGIITAAITSGIFLGGALYALYRYFNINLIRTLLTATSSQFATPLTPYFAFFFFIVLMLLILDLSIRRMLSRNA